MGIDGVEPMVADAPKKYNEVEQSASFAVSKDKVTAADRNSVV